MGSAQRPSGANHEALAQRQTAPDQAGVDPLKHSRGQRMSFQHLKNLGSDVAPGTRGCAMSMPEKSRMVWLWWKVTSSPPLPRPIYFCRRHMRPISPVYIVCRLNRPLPGECGSISESNAANGSI